MTNSNSMKIRAIGSASVLALSVGLTGTVSAQSAPDPLLNAPTPSAPLPPANAEECAIVVDTVTCAPGVDADGFIDFTDNPLGLDVQAGSVVQGAIIISGAATGVVDGSIQTTLDGDGGLLIGEGSDVAVNGFIQTDGDFSIAVDAVSGVTLSNSGTIYTTGNDFADAVSLGAGSAFTNSGLVQSDGDDSFGIFGIGNDVTITNTVDGIVVSSGLGSAAIGVLDDATINNAGLVQTFGDFSVGIDTQNTGTVINSGNIITSGESSTGVGLRDDSSFTNTATGLVSTSGDVASGVRLTVNGTLVNDGRIETSGEGAIGVEAFAGADVTNNGTIITTGDNFSDAVSVRANSTVTNTGLIQTDGAESIAVFGQGSDVSVTNAAGGQIITNGIAGFGITVFDNGTVDNAGLIQTAGDFGIGIDTQEAGTVTNSGTINTAGFSATGVGLRNDSSFTNSATGTVSTTGDEAHGLTMLNNAVIINDGSITTSGDASIAVRTFNNGMITNTGTIASTGAGSDGVSIIGDGTVTNSGTVSSTAGTAVEASAALTLNNQAGATVSGDQGVATGSGASTIANFGTITGTGGTAVAFGDGDDQFQQWQTGVTNGVVDGGAGTDTLVFGNNGMDAVTLDLTTISAGFINFENNQLLDMGGGTTLTGTSGDSFDVLGGDITLDGTLMDTLSIEGAGSLSVTGNGAVDVASGAGVDVNVDDFTISNAGTIRSADGAAIDGGGANALSVSNSGLIEGGAGEAVSFGAGSDQFEQAMGGSIIGDVNLGGGDDTFILGSTASSIAGVVDGGMGADTALLGGTLDADNFTGFENFTLGTMSDLRISGDRTLDGDVVIGGNVVLGLGVDSLTSTGALTLEEGATITIETPLDTALLGQTVSVLEEGTTFTDNGAVINIIDDDLLIDYVPISGSLLVQIVAVNPLVAAGDANVVALGAALNTAFNNGDLSDANFALINGLPDVAAFETLALDSLPSLSNGAAREIFETSSAASDALDRHLVGDSSGIWGDFIIRGAEQDPIGPSAGGYDSDQFIVTIGGDFLAGDAGRVGLLASWADIENDDFSEGTVRGETDIESLKFGIYAGTTFAENGFINGEFAYLTGDVESSRSGLLGVIGSSYDFDGFAYSVTAGFNLLPDSNMALTPTVGIKGASVSFDDATETGGFGFGVEREDADFTELRGGIELSGDVSNGVEGFVRGVFAYDLSDDARSFDLSSAELGSITVTQPERDQTRFELGAGAQFDVAENFSLEVGYQGDFGSGYSGHAASITGRLSF